MSPAAEPPRPLAGRRVVLGVSGGIAAYKAVEVCRRLVDAGAHVSPVLTQSATRFVGEFTFSALASEPVRTSLWGGPEPIPHTRLGQEADLVVVVPATARLLGTYAAGISSDLLTATLLATRAPVLIAPAMHTEMWEHPAVVENVATLRRRGVHFVGPDAGRLAGGDLGYGRLAEPEAIVAAAISLLSGPVSAAGSGAAPATSVAEAAVAASAPVGDARGVRALVTAGGTREPIDAVRYIGNRSSGKQGHAIAAELARRGAEVLLVTASQLPAPEGVTVEAVETAAEMHDAVNRSAPSCDLIVMSAAVADFRPKAPVAGKLKKADGVPEVVLEQTADILAGLGAGRRPGQILVGFAAEALGSSPGPSTVGSAVAGSAVAGSAVAGSAVAGSAVAGSVEAGSVEAGSSEAGSLLAAGSLASREGSAAPGGDEADPGERLSAFAEGKLVAKKADLIVANDVSAPDVGFAHDTNAVLIVAADGVTVSVPLADKTAIATAVVDAALAFGARRDSAGEPLE